MEVERGWPARAAKDHKPSFARPQGPEFSGNQVRVSRHLENDVRHASARQLGYSFRNIRARRVDYRDPGALRDGVEAQPRDVYPDHGPRPGKVAKPHGQLTQDPEAENDDGISEACPGPSNSVHDGLREIGKWQEVEEVGDAACSLQRIRC